MTVPARDAGLRASPPPWWFVALVATCLSIAVGGILLNLRSAPRAVQGLKIDPPAVKVTDRVFGEAEVIKQVYTITNPLKVAVTVRELSTSCSCLATVPNGKTKPPFVLEPGDSAEVELETITRATGDPDQSYAITVNAEAEGKPLPECVASWSFQVENSIKAEPARITILNIRAGTPVKNKLVLYTNAGEESLKDYTLSVSKPKLIHARLVKLAGSSNTEVGHRYQPRFALETTIDAADETVSGEIEVKKSGVSAVKIPVYCSFTQPYNLRPRKLDVQGPPGKRVARRVFFESSEPEWKDIEIVEKSRGVEVELRQFDATTREIRLTIEIPRAGGVETSRNLSVVLAGKDKSSRVAIPIRVEVARE